MKKASLYILYFIQDKGQSYRDKVENIIKNTICFGILGSNMCIFIRNDIYGLSMPWRYRHCPSFYLHSIYNPENQFSHFFSSDSVSSMCFDIESIKGFYLRKM